MSKPITQATINMSVKDLYNLKNMFIFSLPTQRNFVWSKSKKSLFINTLIINMIRPPIFCYKNKDVYEVFDGSQRLRSIFDFIENKFRLSEDTPSASLIIKNKYIDYPLKNKYFHEIDDDVKIELLTSTIQIVECGNMNDIQINDAIRRLNNGQQLTTIEKIRIVGYQSIQKFVSKLKAEIFFVNLCSLSKNQRNKFDDETIIYQLIMAELGIDYPLNINGIEMFVNDLNSNSKEIDASVKQNLIKTIKYLNISFPMQEKFLVKYNILPIYWTAKTALKNNVPPLKFGGLIQAFSKNIPSEYKKTIISNQYSKDNVNKRIDILDQFYKNNIDKVSEYVINVKLRKIKK